MKKNLLLLILLFFIADTFAQKGLPAIGKIDKADLEMKECDFDKNANAVKLIEWGNVWYERGTETVLFKQVNEKRVRIKILKEKGLSFASVIIPYYSYNNDQKITKIEAYTYNLDASGNVKATEVQKSSVFTKRINKRGSELIIAFPEAKIGSVVEYKYRMEREAFWIINDWYFQDKIPTRYSEYQLKVPVLFRFNVHPVLTSTPEVKEEIFDDIIAMNEGVITAKTVKKNYIMKNVAGINDEPFMGATKDYQQHLEFQLSQIDYGEGNSKDYRTNWKDVVKTLTEDEDFGLQLGKEVSGLSDLFKETANIENNEARMSFIYNYVRKNMNWNGEESIYSFDGIKKAWERKAGSTGDINLLLIVLLNEAGIKASPILLSTRENGLVNKGFASLNQFNVVQAYVNLGGKTFTLDATDRISSYKLIPESVANTAGFVVEGEGGKWINLIDHHKYRMMAAIHGDIDSTGIMKGNCLINSIDYAKKGRTMAWKKDKEKFKLAYLNAPGIAIKIDDLTVNNAETDSLPLEQKVLFTQILNGSGEYKYFTANLFSGFDKNPFLEDERMTDVDFGYQQEYNIFGSFSIPDGYVFEELPKNISMIMPDTSIIFNRYMQVEDNLLNERISVEFKHTYYPASDYPEFKEFYKKLLAKLNEQIVIKKKTP